MPPNNNLFNYPPIKDGKELKEIYFSVAIRAFAFSIISIFIPLYLMDIGYSFNQTLVFLGVLYGGLVLIAPLAGFLSIKIGIKHVAIFGPILNITYIVLLFSLEKISIPIYVIAAIGCFGLGFYWIPLNSLFAKHSHKDSRGKETSYLVVVTRSVSVFAPLVGGFLISSLGFEWTFIVSCVILLGAVFPLFMSYEYKSQFKYKFKEMFTKRNLHLFDDFIFQGILFISSVVIFPIYIYFVSNSYEITGAMATVAGIGIAISALIVGKIADKKDRLNLIRIGGMVNLFVWISLMFLHNPLLIYISSFFVGFLGYSITIPLYSFFCDKLGEHEHTQLMVFREIGLSVGKAATLLLLLFFSINNKFTVAFAFAAIASIYFIFADLD